MNDQTDNQGNGIDRVVDFLTHNSPPRLFVYGGIALVLAGVCTYFGLRFQNGLSFSQMQNLMDGDNVIVPNFHEHRTDVLANISGIVLGVLGFLFGVIGALLPMWAVGRLIADAIKSGVQS